METDELCTQQAHLTKRKATVKILQIVEATRTDNTDLPEIHDHVVKQMQDSFSDEGSGRISVRSLWMSEQTMPMTMSFAQPIYPNIIDMVVNNWPSEIRPLGTQRHESLESMWSSSTHISFKDNLTDQLTHTQTNRASNDQHILYDDIRDKVTLVSLTSSCQKSLNNLRTTSSLGHQARLISSEFLLLPENFDWLFSSSSLAQYYLRVKSYIYRETKEESDAYQRALKL